jgi:hypothetical protein
MLVRTTPHTPTLSVTHWHTDHDTQYYPPYASRTNPGVACVHYLCSVPHWADTHSMLEISSDLSSDGEDFSAPRSPFNKSPSGTFGQQQNQRRLNLVRGSL